MLVVRQALVDIVSVFTHEFQFLLVRRLVEVQRYERIPKGSVRKQTLPVIGACLLSL